MDSGADASGAGPLAPGSVLGKYQILRLLAVGGMAELYLCRATGLGGFEKAVALKRILPGLARDPEFVEMFLDEARLTASLNHPNLIQVHDVDRTSDGYFFSMEYVHGKSLAAVLQRCAEKRRGLSMGHALFVLSEVARGLHYAHDKRGRGGQPLGTVHRDVSPGNLMLSYEGAVKIVDFGIAKAALRATKTDAGAVKGTVYYMSPEQAQGVELDRRSDVFSLGVLLYELTTGKRPFRAQNDFAVLHKLVHDAPTPPTEVRASYPPALEAIVLRALAKRPEERFATADDLRQSLDAFVREQGSPLRVERSGPSCASSSTSARTRRICSRCRRRSLPNREPSPAPPTAKKPHNLHRNTASSWLSSPRWSPSGSWRSRSLWRARARAPRGTRGRPRRRPEAS
ncbi:MAG: serine/threonine-protein kinase [Polyangiaceae bacterium]